jgi:hypothetical protein
MDPAAPDPAAHLSTMLDAIAARADEARRRLDALASALDGVQGPVPPAEPMPSRRPDPADPVRLAAIELAVSGSDRTQTAIALRERFPDADFAAILDDVFT